jgi:hypothetical protein
MRICWRMGSNALHLKQTNASADLTSSRKRVLELHHLFGSRLCRANGLLLLIVAALLAPIWTVRYVPLVDYPNHLASAFVLAHLKDPKFAFDSFYGAKWNSYPYLMMTGILLLLQKAVSIDLAGRLLLSLCVLAVPAATWWFLHEVSPGEEMLALWTLVTAQNMYFFLYGFINMQLSLALCLVVLAGWAHVLKRVTIISWSLLMVAATGLYFTHLMGFSVTVLALTTFTMLSYRRFRDLLLGWGLFTPAAIFYLFSEWHASSSWSVSFRPVMGKVVGLLVVVLGFSPALDFCTLIIAVLAWFLACSGNSEFRWRTPCAATAGLLFLLYWAFPSAYGPGLNADRRLLPFVVAFGLAAVSLGRRLKMLAVVALLLFFIRATALEVYFRSLQPRLTAEVTAVLTIPSGSRVLPLVPSGRGVPLVDRHLWAYGVIERGWFSPCLFHDPGVQPFVIKLPAYNPYSPSSCGDLEQIDWTRVRRDYDYLWALKTPRYDRQAQGIASLVHAVEGLRIYRIEK